MAGNVVVAFRFEGQETDDEVYGPENAVSYKYRVHDPRLGRFLSVDPLAPKYPHFSPYSFSGNRVVDAVELEGLEYRLHVNSYFFSAEMRKAINSEDIAQSNFIRLRQLTMLGIQASFENTYLADHTYQNGSSQLPVMDLVYDLSVEGVDVYLTSRKLSSDKQEDIYVQNTVPINFSRVELSNWAGYHDYFDKFYPIDVRAFDSENFGDFYGKNDFVGFAEMGQAVGPGLALGGGTMMGYMKYYGFVAYDVEVTGGVGTLSLSYGHALGVTGSYSGDTENYGPSSLEGVGLTVSGGFGKGPSVGNWWGFDNSGNAVWSGFSGFEFSYGIKFKRPKGLPKQKSPSPSTSGAGVYTNSTLIFPQKKE